MHFPKYLGLCLFALSACSSSPSAPVVTTRQAEALDGCRDITSPGTYVLSGDVGPRADGQTCINVTNTTDVVLDCAGHTVFGSQNSAIGIDGVQRFAVKSCKSASFNGLALRITRSDHGELTGNTFGQTTPSEQVQSVSADQTSRLSVHDNEFAGRYLQYRSHDNSIVHNRFTCYASDCDALVSSFASNHNQISDNDIDGKAGVDVPLLTPGADDGMVIFDDSWDVISGNVIRNVWDMGIETEGVVDHSTFVGNAILNASNGGIGGWYWMSLADTTIADNHMDGVGSGLIFSRSHGLRPANYDWLGIPADTGVLFTRNTFASNTLVHPYDNRAALYIPVSQRMGYGDELSSIQGETIPRDDQFFLTGNVFRDNDFGPDFSSFGLSAPPAGAIVDGGNNVCSSNGAPGFPLASGARSGAAISIDATAQAATDAVSYVTLKGQNFSLDAAGKPGAYTVTSPDCTVVPGQAYSYDGQDPAAAGDPSRRQVNLAIAIGEHTAPFGCTFLVTREGDGRVASVWLSGLHFAP